MTKKTIKKAVPMVVGGLIISMMVSIFPSNFLAEASRGIKEVKEVKIVNKEVVNGAVKYITLEEAEAIALKKLDDKTAKVTYYEIELYYVDPHYDIEVTTKNLKYEFKINGITGTIIEAEVEKIKNDEEDKDEKEDKEDKEDKKDKKDKKDRVKTNNGRFISKEEAKEFALKEVNNKTAKVTGFEIELEKDTPHFLVEIKTTTHRYLMQIDAETGKVLDLKYEARNNDDKDDDKDDDYKIRGNSDKINKEKKLPVVDVKYITKEVAIVKALDKIGTKAILKEIEFEKDNNPPKYEIEMYNDNYEYEIEIHAITGVILKFEKEQD